MNIQGFTKNFLKSLLIVGTSMAAFFFVGCQAEQQEEDQEKTKTEETAETDTGQDMDLPAISNFNTSIAFVPSIGEGTISAIDLNNNNIAWTLKISEGNSKRGPESAMGIAATPDGKWVISGDAANDEVVIVDAEKQEIVKRIPLSHSIHAIDIDPKGEMVWVSGRLPDFQWLTATTVIDVAKMEKVITLSPGLGSAAHFGFTPDGKEVWVASISTNTVWVWDAKEKIVLDVIPLVADNFAGESPEASLGLIGVNEITVAPDGKNAFAAGPEAGVVFSIDVRTRKQTGSVKVGERTHGIAVTRDSKEVWTANNTGTVTILDANTLEILDQIDLSEYADELPYAHIAFSLDGSRAYVSIAQDVAVIDVASREVIATIPFGYGTHENSLEDFFVAPTNIDVKTTSGTLEKDGQDQDKLKQMSNRGGITVTVTYLQEITDKLAFHITLDTHSGDIMENDLTQQSIVRLDNKTEIKSGFKWDPESETSHHRKGTLSVNHKGRSFETLELEILDVGVSSRIFKWEFQS